VAEQLTEAVINRKLDALNHFINEIKHSQISKDIVKIIHYGSTATGRCSPDSDVDVLLVVTGDIKKVDEICSEISYDVLLKTGERVEPMVYCVDDYLYPSHFVYKVKKTGREILAMDEAQIRKNEALDLLTLAKKFNKIAKDIYSMENLRGVVDLVYNSSELCAKAFILIEGREIPKTHGGIINRFSELLVKTGKVKVEIGRMLNRGLDKRNKARYDAHAAIFEEDAKSIIDLSDRLIALLDSKIGV